jgi:hypothetical protein
MRVVKGGHVLSDLGAGNALAPVSGALRQGGKPVARFFISLQDEHGYTLLVRRLIGAQVVLRSGGHVLPDSTLRPGPARLPLRGSVSYRGTVWEAASFHAQAFPRGALRIWLLVPLPPPARASCADVHLNLVARVAHLAYAEALAASKGAAVKLRNSAPLVDAVAARDAGSASAALRTLAAQGRFVRAQVSVNGSPLADAGTGAALAPFAGTLGPPGAGFTVASESDSSYVTLIQAITNARVLVRSGATQLAGSLVPGPVAVPARGTVAYGGVTYSALSFSATAFPQGPLRLSLLVR